MNGATATVMSAKSKFSQNMRPSMPMIARRSIRMPSVASDAKVWIVEISVVIVLKSPPVCCVS